MSEQSRQEEQEVGHGSGEGRVRVLLVDDQPVIRSGFAMILSVEETIEVVGEAATGREAVEIAARERPDVIVMDVQMPEMDGIEATREIVRRDLGKVIILTTFDRDDYLFAALEAGASGFLLKNAEAEQLVAAIEAVGRGDALLAPEVTSRVIARMTSGVPAERSDAERPHADLIAQLTERELEVLSLVAAGMSNQEIAGHLFIGEATVKTHVSNLFAKLGARDRVRVVVIAHEAGIVEGPGTD